MEFGRPGDELTARLAFVDFDGARALVAAESIPADQELDSEFLNTYCLNVVTAVERVVNWL